MFSPGLCLVGFGQAALLPIYTATISAYVLRNLAAAGIALLSCVEHLGSAGAPAVVAKANAAYGTSAGLALIAGFYGCAALAVLFALQPKAIGYRLVPR